MGLSSIEILSLVPSHPSQATHSIIPTALIPIRIMPKIVSVPMSLGAVFRPKYPPPMILHLVWLVFVGGCFVVDAVVDPVATALMRKL